KRNYGNGRQGEREREEWSKEIDKAVSGRGRRVFLEQELQAVRERLKEAVWPNAVGTPARLDVRDDFALEPGKVGENRENGKKQDNAFDERGEQEGRHDFAALSGSELIIVQKRPSEPLVKSVSPAEKISPAGTS